MSEAVRIGGEPVVTLRAQDAPAAGPAFVEAEVAPGRGMMLLQAKLRLPSGEIRNALFAPEPAEAARLMDGGPDDFVGNKSFAVGGAVLIPFANRIRGRALPDAREIEAVVNGETVRLPRNWGGKAAGAEQYAMHGLILDRAIPFQQTAPDRLVGQLDAGSFGGRWPSALALTFDWRLAGGAIILSIEVRNVGDRITPVGIGWHPYLALPSGDRSQARLRLPARLRAEVDNYDEVLPTGRLSPTAGTAYDFGGPEGAALGDLYLDDCFTDLIREDGRAVVELRDPKAGVGIRATSPSPAVKAIQVYAPPSQAFVVVEPQFNLADPFGDEWPEGVDTGMARLRAGEVARYEASLSAFTLGNR